jgi:2-oxo-4-hydroxy-4-carboxy--5-ureidoimidazoline (OHCU) decarboxylase
MLAKLNGEYEDKFPGLRYVVFVNGRPRPVIMENMRARIARGDIKAERAEAIQVCVQMRWYMRVMGLMCGHRRCAISRLIGRRNWRDEEMRVD